MKLLLLILISFQVVFINGQEPCPFNKKECTCNPDPQYPNSTLNFAQVYCQSSDGNLPEFEALPDAKYNITAYMEIKHANLSLIPAGHFKAFQHIRWLNLEQGIKVPDTQQWDDRAFEGIELLALEVHRLADVIPVPKAIQNLGIIFLNINSAPSPVVLKDNSFENMPTLNLLEIYKTPVQSISEKAFAGLEDVLGGIAITEAEIPDISTVTNALRGFNQLAGLNLGFNNIIEIKKDDLAGLTRLENFDLSGNPISNIEPGSFPSDMIYLRCVTISNAAMHTIDISPFADITKETVLPSLSNFNLFLDASKFRTLTTSVTDKFATLGYISAVNSNLETIDTSIRDLLNNVPDSYLDIQFNTHLKCDTLDWMSKFECPGRIEIDGTRCADHDQQPLEDYLKSIDPGTKCHETHQGGIEFFYC